MMIGLIRLGENRPDRVLKHLAAMLCLCDIGNEYNENFLLYCPHFDKIRRDLSGQLGDILLFDFSV